MQFTSTERQASRSEDNVKRRAAIARIRRMRRCLLRANSHTLAQASASTRLKDVSIEEDDDDDDAAAARCYICAAMLYNQSTNTPLRQQPLIAQRTTLYGSSRVTIICLMKIISFKTH